MARSLGVEVSELGPLSLQSKDPVKMNKPCCILTQIEVKRFVFEGRDRADIAAGANDIVAREIMHLVRDVGQENDIAVTGGGAKNRRPPVTIWCWKGEKRRGMDIAATPL
jgi:activator of 2-hydroxyglutaryl-CoA dehydratase